MPRRKAGIVKLMTQLDNKDRLKTKDIKKVREDLLMSQSNKCAICGNIVEDPVLDHDHKTGLIRAVLHRQCNAFLGRIENNAIRHGIKDLDSFLTNCSNYLITHSTDQTGLFHPTYKTTEEKKERAKKRAKKAYQKRKLNKDTNEQD